MAVRKIIKIGDEVLRKKSKPVEVIDKKICDLLDDMADTLHRSDNGVGLACPQVGILKRLIVIDMGEGVIDLINPEIISSEGEATMEEACLSIPGKRGVVTRPFKVKVHAQNRKGETVEYEAEDFLARVFCHEIDHLDGVLYIDRADEMLEDDE